MMKRVWILLLFLSLGCLVNAITIRVEGENYDIRINLSRHQNVKELLDEILARTGLRCKIFYNDLRVNNRAHNEEHNPLDNEDHNGHDNEIDDPASETIEHMTSTGTWEFSFLDCKGSKRVGSKRLAASVVDGPELPWSTFVHLVKQDKTVGLRNTESPEVEAEWGSTGDAYSITHWAREALFAHSFARHLGEWNQGRLKRYHQEILPYLDDFHMVPIHVRHQILTTFFEKMRRPLTAIRVALIPGWTVWNVDNSGYAYAFGHGIPSAYILGKGRLVDEKNCLGYFNVHPVNVEQILVQLCRVLLRSFA